MIWFLPWVSMTNMWQLQISILLIHMNMIWTSIPFYLMIHIMNQATTDKEVTMESGHKDELYNLLSFWRRRPTVLSKPSNKSTAEKPITPRPTFQTIILRE